MQPKVQNARGKARKWENLGYYDDDTSLEHTLDSKMLSRNRG